MRSSLLLTDTTRYAPPYQDNYSIGEEELQVDTLNHAYKSMGQDALHPIVIKESKKNSFQFSDYKDNVGHFQTGYLYEIYYKLSLTCPISLKVNLSRSSSTYSDKMWILLLFKNGSYELIDYADDLNIELNESVDCLVVEGANDIYNGVFEKGKISIDFQGTMI